MLVLAVHPHLHPPGLTALKHPNIIRLVQHINSPQNVIMVFELAEGGDLYQFLCAAPGQRVDEEEGRALFRQVGATVACLVALVTTRASTRLGLFTP